MVPRAVGGVELDAEPLQIPRESGDSLAVGDREQRTHLRGSSSGRFVAPVAAGWGPVPRPPRRGGGGPPPAPRPGGHVEGPSMAWPHGIPGPPFTAGPAGRPPRRRT